MAALAKTLLHISKTGVEIVTLKTIIMFCGVALTVFLILASDGVDTSWAFF